MYEEAAYIVFYAERVDKMQPVQRHVHVASVREAASLVKSSEHALVVEYCLPDDDVVVAVGMLLQHCIEGHARALCGNDGYKHDGDEQNVEREGAGGGVTGRRH